MELQCWTANAFSCVNTLETLPFTFVLTTDASSLSWGAVFKGKETGGQWTVEESLLHININVL